MSNQNKTIERKSFNKRLFMILVIGAIIASIAIIPYQNELLRDLMSQVSLEVPLNVVIVVTTIQNCIMMIIAILIGMYFSKKVNLGSPVLESIVNQEKTDINWSRFVLKAIGWGVIAGTSVIVLDYIFMLLGSPLSLVESELPAWWKALLAGFYGGIGEELLLRFCFMTLLVWAFTKLSKKKSENISNIHVWLSIMLAALLFGLLHLPATAALVSLTPIVIARAILANGVPGVIFGYLYWKKGLLNAMIAHFTADMIIHVLMQLILGWILSL